MSPMFRRSPLLWLCLVVQRPLARCWQVVFPTASAGCLWYVVPVVSVAGAGVDINAGVGHVCYPLWWLDAVAVRLTESLLHVLHGHVADGSR